MRCCTDLGEAQSFSTAACPAWRTHGEDECRTTLEGYGRIAGVPASCR